MQDMELIIFEIISNGGNAKALVYEAMEESEKGNFEEAQKFMDQAGEEMLKAHSMQTDLIMKEANGEKIDIGLIMVHSQDHLMGAILFKKKQRVKEMKLQYFLYMLKIT